MKPMYERMADEIEDAVLRVVKKWRPELRKRKDSRHLLGYWINEGTHRAMMKVTRVNAQNARRRPIIEITGHAHDDQPMVVGGVNTIG